MIIIIIILIMMKMMMKIIIITMMMIIFMIIIMGMLYALRSVQCIFSFFCHELLVTPTKSNLLSLVIISS